MKFKMNMFKLKEGREMKASTFSKLVATTLYEKRFGPYFVSPVVCGLDKVSETEWKPSICTYDSIGYREHSDIFEVAGTGSEFLQGVCETFYKPNMEADQLEEVVANCLLSALDRDSLSGWGAYIYVLTPGEIKVKALKTRMD